jgi:hypothetical protein
MNRNLEHLIGFPINLIGYWIITVIHHQMVDDDSDCKVVIKASFAEFKQAFEKEEWETDGVYRGSLFSRDYYRNGSEFHASVIRINNVGYKLTTYGFIRANILRRKKIEELNRSIKNKAL